MSSSSSALRQAIVAGLFSGCGLAAQASAKEQPASSAAPAVVHGVPKGMVQCFAGNSCKGQNGCAVTKNQLKAAADAFGDKFAKSQPITCAGQASCAAKDGWLSWKSEPTAKDCFAKGGFLMERKDGKLVVKKQ